MIPSPTLIASVVILVGIWRGWRWVDWLFVWVWPPLIFLYFVADVYTADWLGAAFNLGMLVFIVLLRLHPDALDPLLASIVRPIQRRLRRARS